MNPNTSKFRDQHESIFQNAIIPHSASEEEQEENAMYLNYEDHLINLGLIGPSRSGGPQLYLTQLGKMLLKILGRSETVELLSFGITVNPVSAIASAKQEFSKIERDSKVNNKTENKPFYSERTQARKLVEKLMEGL